MKPQVLMALTLADVWQLATSGRGIVLAQGSIDRAATPLAGHGACHQMARRSCSSVTTRRQVPGTLTRSVSGCLPICGIATRARYGRRGASGFITESIRLRRCVVQRSSPPSRPMR